MEIIIFLAGVAAGYVISNRRWRRIVEGARL